MTCIAALAVNDLPVVISDLIVSASKESVERVHVPTVGYIGDAALPLRGNEISSLRQKMGIVEGSTVLAWRHCVSDSRRSIDS
jgi:hypothetical protein